MGIYWQTCILYGIRIEDESITDILSKYKLKIGEYILDETGIFIYLPKTLFKFKSADPVIVDYDIKRGYISKEEVLDICQKSEDYFDITIDENKFFEKIIKEFGLNSTELGFWLVEYNYYNYDIRNICFNFKLPVK